MQSGYAPIDPISGRAYELHHVGQNNNGVLAVLTQDQHRGKGQFAKLHSIWEDSEVVNSGATWDKTRQEFWEYLGNYYAAVGV